MRPYTGAQWIGLEIDSGMSTLDSFFRRCRTPISARCPTISRVLQGRNGDKEEGEKEEEEERERGRTEGKRKREERKDGVIKTSTVFLVALYRTRY